MAQAKRNLRGNHDVLTYWTLTDVLSIFKFMKDSFNLSLRGVFLHFILNIDNKNIKSLSTLTKISRQCSLLNQSIEAECTKNCRSLRWLQKTDWDWEEPQFPAESSLLLREKYMMGWQFHQYLGFTQWPTAIFTDNLCVKCFSAWQTRLDFTCSASNCSGFS